MLQWLWKQKYRLDRGYQLVGMINLLLLLAQSDRLAATIGMSVTLFVVVALPVALFCVWLVGWLITRPAVQIAEDRMYAETTQGRRDLDEILRLLKELQNDKR